MEKQRHIPQIKKKKKQEKSPEKELNEMEATKIPVAEFKTMVIRMLKDLRTRMDGLSEHLNNEIISVKNDIETIKQSEIKNIVSEMKNTLEGINSGLDETDNLTSNLQGKVKVSTQVGQKQQERQ